MSDTTTTFRRRTAGDDAPTITLPDADGRQTAVDYSAHAATVVVFTSNGCPYALAWHERIQLLATDYAGKRVELLQIVCNDDELQPKDSAEAMSARLAAGEVQGTYLRDPQQSVTAAFGATATPEVFVIDAEGVIRYHGAPDGDHDEPSENARFVRAALDSVLAHEPVTRPITSPAGCSVKWRVELLWWDGCPSHEAAGDLLAESLTELGRGDVRVLRVQIRDPRGAADRSFPGSPTFHVGGRDLFPVDAPAALACRAYTRLDGRLSPLPDREDLVGRLREALARPWDLPGWRDFRKTTSRPTGV